MNSPSNDDLKPGFIDWLFSIPFLIVFGLILVIFEILQRIAILFGPRPHEIVAGGLQVAIVKAFHICGMRLIVERDPQLKPNTPYLIIANHQSMFDIPIFGSVLFSNYPKYISKKELGRGIPSISFNLRRGGNALIDRKAREDATKVISDLGEYAQRRGVSVVIFPEGTRARHGELGAFKPLGFQALYDAAPDLDVVFVTIDQSWKLLKFTLTPVPFGVKIRVHMSAPVKRSPNLSALDLLEQARVDMQSNLDRWREEGRSN